MKKLYMFVLLAFILSSCSIFGGSRVMDITPFAENSRTLFGEAIKIERPFPWKYLKDQAAIPEYQEVKIKAKPVIEVLHGIIFYSNQVVAIYSSKLSEKSKAYMLADYLDEAMQKALAKHKEDSVQLDLSRATRLLPDIRNANTYLKALAAAEPIINSVVLATIERINEVQELIPPILAGFTREIEQNYTAAKENYIRLHDLQQKLMLSVTRLYYARLGDKGELAKLLEEDPSLRYFIPSADKAKYENLKMAETYLLDQTKEIELMISQLDDIKLEYRAKYDEVMEWKNDFDQKILLARTSLAIWARAHKNLSAGIPVPPLIDVAGIAGSLAGTVVNVVAP